MEAATTKFYYAGFWPRVGALLIDMLIFAPLIILVLWIEKYSRLFAVYWLIPSALLALWYSVHLVARFGGTPGKLLLKIRIVSVDGLPITWRQAFIRHLPEFALSILTSAAFCLPLLAMSDSRYAEIISLGARGQELRAHMPSWYAPVEIAGQIWTWSEFIVLLTNAKRRALHDFIAGTVVIRTAPVADA